MVIAIALFLGSVLGFVTGILATRSYRGYRREFGYASSAHQPLAWLEFMLSDVSIRDWWLRRWLRSAAYRLRLIGVE